MKLLELYKDMFGNVKVLPKFRDMVVKKRIEYNNEKKFFHCLINWLGGRGYNEFLDYSLLAIKMNYLFQNMKGISDISWDGDDGGGPIKELVEHLLYDDRHDLWQNMPYLLEDIYKEMKKGSDKDNFWKYVTNIVIDCINVHGTEDMSITFVIKE